jgi:small subunit ribosomal protein S27Ae
MKKRELFKVEGEKITRLRRNCPKCGDGVFMAEHKDRLSCGSCGYTEFKGKATKKPTEPSKEQQSQVNNKIPEEKPTNESPQEETPVEPPKENT